MDAPLRRRLNVRIEDGVSTLLLAVMSVLPLVEMVFRRFAATGLTGGALLVQHLTLWLAFTGAAIAARSDELLAISTGSFLPPKAKDLARAINHSLASVVCVILGGASFDLVVAEQEAAESVTPWLPVWIAIAVMPIGFAVVGIRLVWHAADGWRVRLFAAIAPLVSTAMWLTLHLSGRSIEPSSTLMAAGAIAVVVAAVIGMPMFAVLGGLALVFFHGSGTPLAAVTVETYRLAASPLFPAIPLFTLGGYILSSGDASQRFVRVFDAWFGWLAGGPAIVTTLVFAFFTSFTGASGVTILSLGPLLLPVLLKTHFSERFSIGLVTTSGSIGLLFPPSLPVILYAVQAQVPIDELFIGGALPGLVMVLAIGLYGVVEGKKVAAGRTPFELRSALHALWEARYELLLPVVVMAGIFGGFATLVEAAAMTALYAFVVEAVIKRDPSFWRELPKSLAACASLVGGVLLILGLALGLTNFLLDAQIPMHALRWLQQHLESRWAFLLILNVILIAVGAAMDIFSAILVVVPLIVPMGLAFGVDPVHLGVVFLANLQLGYLMPPVGENLFLSSYRFNKPIGEVFRATFPFVVIIFVTVMLITYVPALTLWPVRWLVH